MNQCDTKHIDMSIPPCSSVRSANHGGLDCKKQFRFLFCKL